MWAALAPISNAYARPSCERATARRATTETLNLLQLLGGCRADAGLARIRSFQKPKYWQTACTAQPLALIARYHINHFLRVIASSATLPRVLEVNEDCATEDQTIDMIQQVFGVMGSSSSL